MIKHSLQKIILIYMSVSAILVALFLSSFVVVNHKKSLEHNILNKMHFMAKDVLVHKLYTYDESRLKEEFSKHYIKHEEAYTDSLKSINFTYCDDLPLAFASDDLLVVERLPNGKYLCVSSSKEFIEQKVQELLVELFLGLLIVLIVIIGIFYLVLKKLLFPLKCLVDYCNASSTKQDALKLCQGSYEVNALKDAIVTLQERNKQLCKEKQNIFKEAAHEIKTPLAILRARLDLFSKIDIEKESFIKESKNDINTIGNKLRELIFLKAIEWDIQQAKEHVTMQNQCSIMQQLFRPILQKKQLQLVSNLEEDFELFIHKEAMGRVMQAIFENIFMHTKNGTTIETHIDASTNTLKIVNEVGEDSKEILFSSHIGTKLIERLAPELEYKYITYEKENFFYTEITFEGQRLK